MVYDTVNSVTNMRPNILLQTCYRILCVLRWACIRETTNRLASFKSHHLQIHPSDSCVVYCILKRHLWRILVREGNKKKHCIWAYVAVIHEKASNPFCRCKFVVSRLMQAQQAITNPDQLLAILSYILNIIYIYIYRSLSPRHSTRSSVSTLTR